MPSRMDDRVRCSFCGKTQDQVKKLIAGSNNVFICDDINDWDYIIVDAYIGIKLQGFLHAVDLLTTFNLVILLPPYSLCRRQLQCILLPEAPMCHECVVPIC